MLLVQYQQGDAVRVGVLDTAGRHVVPLAGVPSMHALALQAIRAGVSLATLVHATPKDAGESYDTLLVQGRLLPPLTHPDPAHCVVTGTGLTHLGSAESRNAMHQKLQADTLTDSMKMFQLGLAGGKPAAGATGVAPEWFYKGDGTIVRATGQPLSQPAFALDGGDEAEIAGLYVIGPDGTPYRLGYALGNEYSDHVLEQQNYLYLAHSKLRECSVGPALRVGDLPAHVDGVSRIRDAAGQVRWEQPFLSGEDNMCHAVANLEHHHFKYAHFRQPGDVHVHFFGAAVLSFADKVQVAVGDTFEIESPAFGPALHNTVRSVSSEQVHVRAL